MHEEYHLCIKDAVYTCMYVFDDVNSVFSWPNNFFRCLYEYKWEFGNVDEAMMQKKIEINVWLAGQSLLIPYSLK